MRTDFALLLLVVDLLFLKRGDPVLQALVQLCGVDRWIWILLLRLLGGGGGGGVRVRVRAVGGPVGLTGR